MDPKGKGMVVNDKEKESFVNDPKDDKPTDSGSGHKRKDGRKKKTRRIKEIVYYDSDESSSSQKDDDNDYEKKKTVNSNVHGSAGRRPFLGTLGGWVIVGTAHLSRIIPGNTLGGWAVAYTLHPS